MKPINLSFSASGFLAIYQLGAISALCRHGRKLLKDVEAFAGASAGSLLASILLTAPEKIEESKEFVYEVAEETRSKVFGVVTPGYDIIARLRSKMDSILPPNAHQLADGRLYVSVTDIETRRNVLVSSFPSREDLLQVLMASSYVPLVAGLKLLEHRGQKLVDGVFSNSLPILPVGRTVTISILSGRSDISPQDKGQRNRLLTITNQEVMLSVANLVRIRQVFFAPPKTELESLHQHGFDDAVRFLRKEDTLPQNHSLLLTDVRRGEVASTLSHAAGRTSERAARTRPSNDVSSAISK